MVLNIKEKIIKLKKFLNSVFKNVNKENCIRNRKIDFLDVFYFINLYNSDPNVTYDKIYNKLICENTYKDITKNAFIKKRNDLSVKHFEFVNNELLKYIYKDLEISNKPRYLSIDSSNLCFLSKLSNDFKSNKHNTYTNGHLSCLYDIDLQIPVNYNLSESSNERDLLIEQFSYIKPGDVLIADRGYYSDALIDKLIYNKISFIFRVKKSELKVKMFEQLDSKSDINIISEKNSKHYFYDYKYGDQIIKFKFVKYQTYFDKNIEKENIDELKQQISSIKINIENSKHMITELYKEKKKIIEDNKIINKNINDDKSRKEIIKNNVSLKKNITNNIKKIQKHIDSCLKFNNKIKEKINLINKVNDSIYYIITDKIELSDDKIKDLYKKRWEVETHFRFAKDKFKMRTMESKTSNIIYQNIYTTQFIFILEGYFETLMSNEIKKNKKINKASFIHLLHNYLIKHILISKNNEKTYNLINNILLTLIKNIIDVNTQIESKPRLKKRPGSKWINIIVTT